MKKLEQGFTLIELLVVVAIIGILAAIAIPQYAAYKKQSVDAKMKSDLHNAATAMEAYYGSNGNSYDGANANTDITPYGYNQSPALNLTIASGTDTFVLTAEAPGGNFGNWTFSSDSGQIVGN